MMGGGDFQVETLRQLVQSIGEAGIKLEESYKNKNYTNFNKIKKTVLMLQKKIEEIIK